MTTHVPSTLIGLVALITSAASAAPTPDPSRCQARELRCESDFYQCLARCDQRAPRPAFPAGSRPVMSDPACEAGCAVRYDDGMARLAGSTACGAVDAPDPARCEARLLRASALRLTCAARCAGRSVDVAPDCALRCETRCRATVDQTSAGALCAAGRLGTTPLCGETP